MKTLNGTEFRAAVKTASAFMIDSGGGDLHYADGYIVAHLTTEGCTVMAHNYHTFCEIPLQWTDASEIPEQWVRFKPHQISEAWKSVTLSRLRRLHSPPRKSLRSPSEWAGALKRGTHKFQTHLEATRWAVGMPKIAACWISNDDSMAMWDVPLPKGVKDLGQRVFGGHADTRCDEFPDGLTIGLAAVYLRKIFEVFPAEDSIALTVGGPTDVVLFETAAARIWVMPIRPSGKQ